MEEISLQMAALNRAKEYFKDERLDKNDMIELSILMNDYIDFLQVFNNHSSEEEYINQENMLRAVLNGFCDNLDESFVERREVHGMRY